MRCSGWIRFGRIALVFLVLASAARWGNAAVAAVGQARPVHSAVAQGAPASLWEQLQMGIGNLLQLLGFGSSGAHAKAAAAGSTTTAADGTSPSGQGGSSGGDLFPGIDPNGGLRAGGN